MADKVTITICMGSSCFARGNERNLDIIEAFIRGHELDEQVDLVGSRCENCCNEGPNIKINDTFYHNVDQGTLVDILKEHLL